MRHINNIAILTATLLSAASAFANDTSNSQNAPIGNASVADNAAEQVIGGDCGGTIELAPSKGNADDAGQSFTNIANPGDGQNPLPGTPKQGGQRPGLFADLSHDGIVDSADLMILVSQWGTCAPYGNGLTVCSGDLNGDGFVLSEDLALLMRAWTSPESAPVTK